MLVFTFTIFLNDNADGDRINTINRTPTGVIAHETCADNFLYRPKLVLRLHMCHMHILLL